MALGFLAMPRLATAAAPVEEAEVAPGLRIRRRSSWDEGRGPTGSLEPEDVRFLLVHHTATNTDHAESDVPSILRSSYEYHTGPDKGWPDICYNFLIDRSGGVWEGRTGSIDGPVRASATGGSQGFAQLVCIIGDFTSVAPTDAAQAALVRTLAWLGDRYGIDTTPGTTIEFVSRGSNLWPEGETVVASTISGHRQMSATGCPGDTFFPILVDEVPARATLERAVMFPSAEPPAPAPAPAPVATLEPPPPNTEPAAPSTEPPPPSTEPPTTVPSPVAETAPSASPTTTLSSTPATGSGSVASLAEADGAATTNLSSTTSPPVRLAPTSLVGRSATTTTERDADGRESWVAGGAVAAAAVAAGAGFLAVRQRHVEADSGEREPLGLDGPGAPLEESES
ncbi:MAG: N-acetylmuramoyl-L-alanine amidase [Ilumatobacteraceae bacterium]